MTIQMQRCHIPLRVGTDFVIRELDLNKEPEIQRESKTSGKMLGHS